MFQKDFIVYNPERYQSVIVTGSWCNWSETGYPLTKIPGLYWIATVPLPYATKIQYKYIIDGQWQTLSEDPIETDNAGNTNNVFTVPAEKDLPGPLVGATGSTKQEPILATTTSSSGLPGATQGSTDRQQPASHELADTGVAAAAAAAATAAGLGHDEHEKSAATTAGPAAASSGLNHVPTGGNVAQTGIAAEAAREAQKHGLGHAEGETGGSVQGATKIAPGVVQATSEKSGVVGMSDSDLAKPAGVASASGSTSKAPLPASTGDAPLVPGSLPPAEGKGLFSVLGDLGAAAAAAAAAAATNVVHRVTDDHPQTATAGTAQSSKEPLSALAPIASGDTTSKLSKELAAVDLSHTKAEVVNVVERFGGALAGGLAGLGNMAGTGTLADTPATAGETTWAKQSASMSVSAFGNTAKRNSVDASAGLHIPDVLDIKLPAFSTLLPASLASSLGATTDAQRVAAHTGGLAAATPSGSAANTPAVTAEHQAILPPPGLAGSMNNAAGAVGSSATVREASPARAAVSSASGAHTVPGLDIQRSGTSAASSAAPQVPGLSINGSSSTATSAAAATTAATGAAAAGSSVPGLNIEKKASTASASAPSVPGLSINGSSASGTSAEPKSIHDGPTTGTKPAVGKDTNAASSAGRALGEDAPNAAHVAPTAPAPTSTSSTPATTPANTVSKKDTSALGKGQPAAAPVTPKKSGAGGASNDTPATDGYKTAPSTPASQAGTPADKDRKRKSSIFKKIKSAFSPGHENKS